MPVAKKLEHTRGFGKQICILEQTDKSMEVNYAIVPKIRCLFSLDKNVEINKGSDYN